MRRSQLVRVMKKFFYPKETVDDLLTDKETIEINKNQVKDFPSSIPASAHTHTKSEITDFPTSITPSKHSHTKSEISDFPSTMTPSSHNHGNLNNQGLLNSDTTGADVKKVVVTDSTQNLKTINKIPFSNLDVSKANITGLGIPASDTNTTYSVGTGLKLNGTTFNVFEAPAEEIRHTITEDCDFSNINKTGLPVDAKITQNNINELIDARLGELFTATGNINVRQLSNSDMQSGRFDSDSFIRFYRIGKICIANYRLKGNNISFNKGTSYYVCNFPEGFIPNSTTYLSTWVNATSAGQLNVETTSSGVYQAKIYIATANTSNNIVGQLIYFTQ
ncbi:MAG: hypothetical protein IJ104_02900 [Methanobrevibacter sp.]|nr:hypothetical protein [Methanobrevibacter sp.]